MLLLQEVTNPTKRPVWPQARTLRYVKYLEAVFDRFDDGYLGLPERILKVIHPSELASGAEEGTKGCHHLMQFSIVGNLVN